MHETVSQNCSANKDESKQSIVKENLSQNYYADVDELCSTGIDISDYTITEQKGAEYEGSSATKVVLSYFLY